MDKKTEVIVKLLRQQNGEMHESDLLREASLLNIESEDAIKRIEQLNWVDCVRMFGKKIVLTEKGFSLTF